MLPTQKERREAVDIVRRIGYADGETTPESEAVLTRIARILGLGEEGKPEPVREAPARRTGAIAK